MKYFLISCFFLISYSAYNQNVNTNISSDENKLHLNLNQFDKYISDVYQADGLNYIKQNDEHVYNSLKLLYENYMQILSIPYDENEKYESTLSIPLFTAFNTNLTYDNQIDLTTFNPFKYDIKFFSSKKKMYRLAKSDYVLLILPFNK